MNGTNSIIWYEWSSFWGDLTTVEIWPGGNPTCIDPKDTDKDGYYDENAPLGMTEGEDCNDHDSYIHPFAQEVCDNIDNDCNGLIDDGPVDNDKDGKSDECDTDDDNDTILDLMDNCPVNANMDQKDSDNDRIGNSCDKCQNDPNDDEDKDGLCSDKDNCPAKYNPGQMDLDNDNIGNNCDNDMDGDTFLNEIDNCPANYNPCQEDYNKDGKGDICQCSVADFKDYYFNVKSGKCPDFKVEKELGDFYKCGKVNPKYEYQTKAYVEKLTTSVVSPTLLYIWMSFRGATATRNLILKQVVKDFSLRSK